MKLINGIELVEYSETIKKYKDAYDLPWKIIRNKQMALQSCPNMNIAIMNAPCNGFGDVIFAIKLKRYLKDWYNCKNVKVVTTRGSDFIKLGEDEKDVLQLVAKKERYKEMQCRRFQGFRLKQQIPFFDLFFVAPLQADYEINISDIRGLFPYANYFNTFFFSEYNDIMSKNFDFPTGVGSGRMGLMLGNLQIGSRNRKLKNPYVVIYIAETIERSIKCFLSFIEMVCAKYGSNDKYKEFDIVVAPWIENEMRNPFIQKKMKFVFDNYSYLNLVNNQGTIHIKSRKPHNNKVLNIRGDVLPVTSSEMITLMARSEEDILLTGDQSITDALSCCSNKNIFYQIAAWKENFASNLAKELPQEYLKRKTTSCGTIKAIKYKSDFREFIHKWDFRKLAKPKLDAILYMAMERKKNIELQIYENLVLNSRNIPPLKMKIKLILGNTYLP